MYKMKNYNPAIKFVGKSQQFKYVQRLTQNGKELFYARLNKYRLNKMFKDERAAAIWVDKKLIERGKKPVNILKKLT